ncbi:glycosyltransferase involved in cell wall biosynthesis [Paramicrobacterium agarici]|uniref:D-inositol 3-phosphate glycosyltransferase n=1 Tax=Paramicrobacterium agarici TaxID=630514 RepID=A0A2A9DZ29_9MICO|nr:glycosyltransferase [Microbacterium agarici]PFG31232.1 glycosyltransferase involved in cell wall biosynthesis [Microbacterium agarici]TQO24334.1 glycosyltransferase involved in cell wall biosynthesis [Microbacterium agarici]
MSENERRTGDSRRSPLRVLIAADTFAPDVNGAARFAERLAAGLVERGHDVHVVAPASSRRHGTWTETHEGQRMTVHRLYSWRWFPHDWLRFALPWRSRKNAARILDAVKPDVVHSQSFLVVGRGMTIEAARRGIRVVATNHLMPENLLEFTLLPRFVQEPAVKTMWRDARKILSLASAVTTPTRRAADFLERSAGRNDVHAISCGIDASLYHPVFEKRTENRIIFVGRITGEKQIDVLIKAFSRLDESLDAKLEIIGGGDQKRNLEALAQQLGVADRVTFTGYVTDEQLKTAYSRATVLAMPSIAELQSIVTMEAMATALPVVAANAMALPHLVHDGENGYLFTPGDEHELAARLTDVLTLDEKQLEAMKRASLRMIRPHDIQNTLTTFESLYRGEAVIDPVTDVSDVSDDERRGR